MLINGNELRPADRKKIQRYPERQSPIVKPECPETYFLAKGRSVPRNVAEAEVDQAYRQEAECAEQCSMRVVQRQECTVVRNS